MTFKKGETLQNLAITIPKIAYCKFIPISTNSKHVRCRKLHIYAVILTQTIIHVDLQRSTKLTILRKIYKKKSNLRVKCGVLQTEWWES